MIKRFLALVVLLVMSMAPVEVSARPEERGEGLAALAAGGAHTCALLQDSTVRCWGANEYGGLGDGTRTQPKVPVTVSGLAEATALTAGLYHTCALLSNGSVWCWGANDEGRLGDGTKTASAVPVQVKGISTAAALSAGSSHTCALLMDNTVRCWGNNLEGQLGDGTTFDRTVPVPVSGLSSVTVLAAGGGRTCALLRDGPVRCWGMREFGLAEPRIKIGPPGPVSVSGLSGGTAIAAGEFHTCALLRDSTVRCWGRNGSGQLGDGTTTERSTPVGVVGLAGVTALAAGGLHTCALLQEGAVSCWGRNESGQLGDRTRIDHPAPVPVSGITTATAIAAGSNHTCALLRDGTVRCWGSNRMGELGKGGMVIEGALASPVQVLGITTAMATPFLPTLPAPPALSVEASFDEPSGNNLLDAGEAAVLWVSVANAGPGPAYGVRAEFATETPIPGLTIPDPIEFGTVPPYGSIGKSSSITATGAVATQRVTLKVEVKEKNGFDAEPLFVDFQSKALRGLEVADLAIGGSGVVQRGQATQLKVTVKNTGAGTVQDVNALLILGSRHIFPMGRTQVALGTVGPGETKTAVFEFSVNKRFQGRKLPIALTLTESQGRQSLRNLPLNLALGEPAPNPNVFMVEGEPAPQPPLISEAPTGIDVDTLPQGGIRGRRHAHAVVVGIEKYRDLPSVDFAEHDAKVVSRYFEHALGVPPENIKLLLNERATKGDLEAFFEKWLRSRVEKGDAVYVYYAGHGAPHKTGKAFLVPHEGNATFIEETGYPLERLYQSLSALPAQQIVVFLDSCFSGAGGRSVMAKGARPMAISVENPVLASGKIAVLSAASGAQISHPYPTKLHGLFTYFLLKGLQGGADLNKDASIELHELFEYLRPQVERVARQEMNDEQYPQLFPVTDKTKIELVTLR